MAIAPPAGTVLATAGVGSVCTNACGDVRPGAPITVGTKYAAGSQIANPSSTPISSHVTPLIGAHPSEKPATFFFTYQTTATTRTTDIPIWRTWRVRLLCD